MPPALSALIVAQARHETGNFTSNVFKKCANLFGYKAVYSAPKCTGSPEGDYYEDYKGDYLASVDEVVNWIKRRQREGRFPDDLSQVNTPAIYARLLKENGYYGAPEAEYRAALARHLGADLGPPTGGTGTLLLFGLAIAAALMLRRGK